MTLRLCCLKWEVFYGLSKVINKKKTTKVRRCKTER